jgi:hypothetical protein
MRKIQVSADDSGYNAQSRDTEVLLDHLVSKMSVPLIMCLQICWEADLWKKLAYAIELVGRVGIEPTTKRLRDVHPAP